VKTILAKVVLCGLMALTVPGCGPAGTNPDGTPANPANPATLQLLAQVGVVTSLTLEIKRLDPVTLARVLKDLKAIDDSITQDVIPLFDGTKGSVILVSATDDILAKLKGMVTDPVSSVIGTAIAVVGSTVPLPDSPTASLDANTKADVLAVVRGIKGGIEIVLAQAGQPAPVVNPTARSAPAPVWPHQKK
jgi:hypothetical protein